MVHTRLYGRVLRGERRGRGGWTRETARCEVEMPKLNLHPALYFSSVPNTREREDPTSWEREESVLERSVCEISISFVFLHFVLAFFFFFFLWWVICTAHCKQVRWDFGPTSTSQSFLSTDSENRGSEEPIFLFPSFLAYRILDPPNPNPSPQPPANFSLQSFTYQVEPSLAFRAKVVN